MRILAIALSVVLVATGCAKEAPVDGGEQRPGAIQTATAPAIRPGTTATAEPEARPTFPTVIDDLADLGELLLAILQSQEARERDLRMRAAMAAVRPQRIPERGPTPHSSSKVPPKLPDDEARMAYWSAILAKPSGGVAAPARTCGPATDFFVACPADPDPRSFAGYYLLMSVLKAPLPPKTSPNLYTYAFVLDVDGRSENNFMPAPEFPNDFFAGTDRWYEITKAPGADWRLEITVDPLTGRRPTRSGARALIKGNALMLLIPQEEFGGIHPNGLRVTAFKHSGDFGVNPPHNWSGDVFPGVGEPLLRFPSGEVDFGRAGP